MSSLLKSSLKVSVSRLTKYLDKANGVTIRSPSSTESPTEQRDMYDQQSRLIKDLSRKIGNVVDEIEKLEDKWLNLIEKASAEEKAAEEKIFEEAIAKPDNFLVTKALAKEQICTLQSYMDDLKLAMASLDNETLPPSSGTSSPNLQVPSHSLPEVKLPTLFLKQFDGDCKQWREFKDSFETAIHRQNIPKVQKLIYLVNSLRGEAAKIVEGFPISSENYDIVWDTLKLHYGDENITKQALYMELQNLPKATKEAKGTILNIEKILRQLESLGENINNTQMALTIQQKLPYWVLRELFEAHDSAELWNIGVLRKHLQKIVLRGEALNRTLNETGKAGRLHQTKESKRKLDVDDRTYSHSSAFLTTVMHAGQKMNTKKMLVKPKTRRCAFCEGQHWDDKCEKFNSLEQRKERVKELHLCWKCLQTGHTAKQCSYSKKCFHCKGNHNTALCQAKSKQSLNGLKPKIKSEANVVLTDDPIAREASDEIHVSAVRDRNQGNTTLRYPHREEVLLLCREVEVVNLDDPSKCVTATAFFDAGSQLTFVTQNLVNELGVKKQKTDTISISAFAGKQPTSHSINKVQLGLKSNCKGIQKLQANAIDYLTTKVQVIKISDEDAVLLKNDGKVPMLRSEWKQPDLLVGIDHYFDFIQPENAVMTHMGFVLVPTTLGYILGGKGTWSCSSEDERFLDDKISQAIIGSYMSIEGDKSIETFWRLDTIGISDCPLEDDDEKAIELFQKTIRRESDGRYSVGWPWKTENPQLQSNFAMCYGRLKSVLNKLKEHPEILAQYDAVFKEQLKLGIIEQMNSADRSGGFYHYIPHHAVFTPGKNTTKLRVVFDASAKCKNGRSLNDMLYKGPTMLRDLCGMLIRFRFMETFLIADVEKAFHQIALNEQDRDTTRFLWVNDFHNGTAMENIRTYRFKRIPFGVISSPFLLAATLRHHLTTNGTELAIRIMENLYVDNIILEVEPHENGKQLYQEVKKLFADAQMNIREFLSNDPGVMMNIPDQDRQQFKESIKVLGIQFNLANDDFVIKFKPPQRQCLTKREILRFLAEHFDPVGLIAPALLPVKLFIQDLWRNGYSWDQEIDNKRKEEWVQMTSQWTEFEFPVKRNITLQRSDSQLHIFVDASQLAYAAVVFLRTRKENERAVRLIFSKSRLCPIKGMSTPRLELLAMLIGVRVSKFVTKEAKLENCRQFIWSDSKCVLQWIRNKGKLQPKFVANRLEEIWKFAGEICYIPGELNPADLATRGTQPRSLCQNPVWWNGPEWLQRDEESWPLNEPLQEPKVEVSSYASVPAQSLHCQTFKNQPEGSRLIDFTRCSNWKRLMRMVCFVLRFGKITGKEKVTYKFSTAGPFTEEDFCLATRVIIKRVQQDGISEAERQRWQLYKDDLGLYRCGGRLQEAVLPQNTIHPIYLPNAHWVTDLIILHHHTKTLHSGVTTTLLQVRQFYWFAHGRNTVKKAIANKCYKCRRWSSKPFKLPPFPQYPVERVRPSRAFENVGLDYAGPVKIRTNHGEGKRWICLWTCFTTRAVHLELTVDMSANAFLQAFRRFVARRGKPALIYSDNATQFKAAEQTIKHLQEENNAIREYCSSEGIKWAYITAHAPWQGGLYERLIGIMKNALRRAVGRKLLNEVELTTLLTETEAVVNSRPLTQVHDDSLEVIRPIDFLCPKADLQSIAPLQNCSDDPDFSNAGVTRTQLLKRWEATSRCLNKFWTYWSEAYLTSLRERTQKWHNQKKGITDRFPEVGEIVLIKEDDVPRGVWKLGKVLKITESRDGFIRSATVRLSNGSEWKRPICYLYPLEVTEKKQRTEPQPKTMLDTDKNLEAEESESETDEKNQHRRVEGRSEFTSYSVTCKERTVEERPKRTAAGRHLFFILCAMILWSSNVEGKKRFQICTTRHSSGIMVAIPPLKNCTVMPVEQVLTTNISVYTKTYLTYPAIYCAKITRKVCTRAFFRFILEVVSDDVDTSAVPVSVCRTLDSEKHFKGAELHQISQQQWKTNNELLYAYGWFGTRCTVNVNYLLEYGGIATSDGIGIMSDLSGTAGCLATEGSCITNRGTILWNATNITEQCYYEHRLTTVAHATTSHVLIETLQASLIYASNSSTNLQYCGLKNPQFMENDIVITFNDIHTNDTITEWMRRNPDLVKTINSESNKLMPAHQEAPSRDAQSSVISPIWLISKYQSLYTPDQNNPKYQFLYDTLQEQIKKSIQQSQVRICQIQNELLQNVRWKSLFDPTAAARQLLERDDIKAKNVGDTLLLYPCQEIFPTEIFYDHKVDGKCYEFLPIKIGRILMFVSPHSSDVISMADEIDCAKLNPPAYKYEDDGWNTPNGKVEVMEIHHQSLSNRMTSRTFNAGPISMTDEERIDMSLAVVAAHQTHEWLVRHSTKKVSDKDIWDDITQEEKELSNKLESAWDTATDEIQEEFNKITNHWRSCALIGATILLLILIIYLQIQCQICSSCFRCLGRKRSEHRYTARYTAQPRTDDAQVQQEISPDQSYEPIRITKAKRH